MARKLFGKDHRDEGYSKVGRGLSSNYRKFTNEDHVETSIT